MHRGYAWRTSASPVSKRCLPVLEWFRLSHPIKCQDKRIHQLQFAFLQCTESLQGCWNLQQQLISYSHSSGRTVSLKLILQLAQGFGAKLYAHVEPTVAFCHFFYTGIAFLEVMTSPSGTESRSFNRIRKHLFHLVLQLCPEKKTDLLLNIVPSSCAR